MGYWQSFVIKLFADTAATVPSFHHRTWKS